MERDQKHKQDRNKKIQRKINQCKTKQTKERTKPIFEPFLIFDMTHFMASLK